MYSFMVLEARSPKSLPYGNKFNNLDEMVKFLKRHKLSNVTEEETDNLSSLICIREIKVIVKQPTLHPPKNNREQKTKILPGPDDSSVNSTEHLRKK